MDIRIAAQEQFGDICTRELTHIVCVKVIHRCLCVHGQMQESPAISHSRIHCGEHGYDVLNLLQFINGNLILAALQILRDDRDQIQTRDNVRFILLLIKIDRDDVEESEGKRE